MTTEQYAKDLIEKYIEYSDAINEFGYAKECAIIDVENTLNVLRKLRATVDVMREYRFYLEVKYKIKKL